ncbi:hypothetical protein ABIC83_002421 [Roseateles asaccharophilus]|uniref:hypothetical protein n=1 Tax=Roseateles asaccharophilus TaxID=582607 RepID=UPI003837235F
MKGFVRFVAGHRVFVAVLALALFACVAYLIWGVMGLIGIAGASVGLGLPLLLGPSSKVSQRDQGVSGPGWKWDGSPDDGGSPAGDGFKD